MVLPAPLFLWLAREWTWYACTQPVDEGCLVSGALQCGCLKGDTHGEREALRGVYFKAISKAVTVGSVEPAQKLPVIGFNFVSLLRKEKFRV